MNDFNIQNSGLPIETALPEILKKLMQGDNLVLQAPPGAGKTTLVPLHLLNQLWAEGRKIILLEPRRLAARAAANRMAEMIGEKVGQTVGYRVRLDHKIGPTTRLEVVTEGVLIRKLQDDPELTDVCAVIFDEFHERSLEADFGLSLCLDVQQGLRDDLKILVMSATLEGENVARLMGNAPIVTSEGRSYPVDMKYLDRAVTGRIEPAIADVIETALSQDEGSLLVFLPGAGEIERCADILRSKNFGDKVLIAPLYGMMRSDDQDLAIKPAPAGYRKIVLATAIAETSLTIDGIRIVIDGGLDRSPRYDVRSGMMRLETKSLSKASAEQRAGRAGRLSPGICYRMWTEAAHRGLIPFAAPEISKTDLTSLVLDLANWGVTNPADMKWLDLPDMGSVSRAQGLLTRLGAIDESGRILDHGRQMARLAMHPRLAHMVITARARGFGRLAVAIAALLTERDILRQSSADLRDRVKLLDNFSADSQKPTYSGSVNRGALQRIKRQRDSWIKSLKLSRNDESSLDKTGICLALAYPDRLGGRRPGGQGKYLLSGGQGAILSPEDDLNSEKYLAICTLSGGDRDARVYMAAPLEKTDIEDIFHDRITLIEEVSWDNRRQEVVALKKEMLDKLPLREDKLNNPNAEVVAEGLCQGIRKMGLACLPWDKKSQSLRDRVMFCAKYDRSYDWSDMSELGLLDSLDNWLVPYVKNIMRRDQLKGLNLVEILMSFLSWQDQKRLDELVPSHIKVPSGSSIAIDYAVDPPVLAVRLQEMFGHKDTPTILSGKVTLLVHLLSPAQRPIQVTQDLENFWVTSYESVKKDMKGQYPRHNWPDDPLSAIPSRRSIKNPKSRK